MRARAWPRGLAGVAPRWHGRCRACSDGPFKRRRAKVRPRRPARYARDRGRRRRVRSTSASSPEIRFSSPIFGRAVYGPGSRKLARSATSRRYDRAGDRRRDRCGRVSRDRGQGDRDRLRGALSGRRGRAGGVSGRDDEGAARRRPALQAITVTMRHRAGGYTGLFRWLTKVGAGQPPRAKAVSSTTRLLAAAISSPAWAHNIPTEQQRALASGGHLDYRGPAPCTC